MRFKSRMAAEHISLLHSIVTPISRLTSSSSSDHNKNKSNVIGSGSTIYLDPTVLRISSRGGSSGSSSSYHRSDDANNNAGEGIACFAELITTHGIFLEHKIESVAGNVIVFDIDLVQFRTALAATLHSMGGSGGGESRAGPLHNSKDASFRTSLDGNNNNNSSNNNTSQCLCLDASCVNGTLDVHHAVPVRILRAEEWQNHLPPIVNTPDVQLEFQLDRHPLRPVIERLKSISPTLYIDGSMSGEFIVRVENDAVSINIKTFYDKLVPRIDDDDDSHESSGVKKCTVKMDSKKLYSALQWQSTVNRHAVNSYIVCLIRNEMMVVHVMIHPEELGFFTYYIPVYYLGDDQF